MTARQTYYKNNREKVLESQRAYYIRNREKKIAYARAYKSTGKPLAQQRKSQLTTTEGTFRGLNKRDYTGYCEMCNKEQTHRLQYHHWDDSNPSLGMWLCNACHWFVEGFERGLQVQKYIDLKAQLQNANKG